VPGVWQGAAARIVELRRIQVQVEPGRLVDELELRQTGSAVLGEELREVLLHLSDLPPVLLLELAPARPLINRKAREHRRQVGIL
jgi:hypothetical protein